MGSRKQRARQQELWIVASDVVETPGNAFYDRLNRILAEHKFDQKVEAVWGICATPAVVKQQDENKKCEGVCSPAFGFLYICPVIALLW